MNLRSMLWPSELASAEQLKTLRERPWEATEILVIYIDGHRFGAPHIVSAVGVDREGRKRPKCRGVDAKKRTGKNGSVA